MAAGDDNRGCQKVAGPPHAIGGKPMSGVAMSFGDETCLYL
jgi:hypothetical protein